MSYDQVFRSLKDATVVIKDGTGTPNECTVVLDDGGVKFSLPKKHVLRSDRGEPLGWRTGPNQVVPVSFSGKYSTFISDTGDSETPTPYEALRQAGAASGWTSVDAEADAYATNIELTINNPASGGKDEKITFSKVVIDSIEFSEGEDGDTLSFTGQAISATITRVA